MRILVQRSKESNVSINKKIVGKIDFGLVVLVGFKENDTIDDIKYLVHKLLNLRIFEDENGLMNLNIKEVGGSILSISQFTLYGNTKEGNRPSFKEAMKYDLAEKFYNLWIEELKNEINVETGIFGEDMLVNINNDGPITILLESRNKNDKK